MKVQVQILNCKVSFIRHLIFDIGTLDFVGA
jgi:hypothetical protein